ncbi:MAG: CTP synthetase [Shimia sp.]|uniref:CTP synthetase n=1 Tax=Shimia sp. TaxID=1954381 RepID=UPI0019D97731|nr:CTP synthetase [Shimia sp.]MBE1292069.1 CTP synthetase [Paracoccaceae bacterium]MBO6899012.1 CTP synthetase [Shimia sp.]MEC8197667.1 CTP synthetase [Pseudomonadota bacterium]
MLRLALMLHIFIGSTLAGVGVIATLVMGGNSGLMMLAAALAGFVVAFPVSWKVAQALYARPSKSSQA